MHQLVADLARLVEAGREGLAVQRPAQRGQLWLSTGPAMFWYMAGDRATGIGYMWFVAVTAPGRTSAPYSMGGPYDWEFRRDGDGWLLARQRLGVLWTDGDDTLRAFEPE
ncbi:nuclear transport factor 2 family protein [Streptomyces sp. NPDC059118]|uniref:nuclear transport factor 2 family protein n=1 Tax=unclassified Streptomyces TaxID=2593676 RepID=UPI0036BF7369